MGWWEEKLQNRERDDKQRRIVTNTEMLKSTGVESNKKNNKTKTTSNSMAKTNT